MSYLKKKYEKQIVVETGVLLKSSSESIANIEKALTDGSILVMKNCEMSAFDVLQPIIEWKYRRSVALTRFLLWRQSPSKQSLSTMQYPSQSTGSKKQQHPLLEHGDIWHDEEVFAFNERTRTSETLLFNNKLIAVHKNFRLLIVQSGSRVECTFSHSLFNKLVFLRSEIEDEIIWKQTIFDHLLNQFHLTSK